MKRTGSLVESNPLVVLAYVPLRVNYHYQNETSHQLKISNKVTEHQPNFPLLTQLLQTLNRRKKRFPADILSLLYHQT